MGRLSAEEFGKPGWLHSRFRAWGNSPMPVRRALAAFKTERLNCAQSILRAFQAEMGISEDAIRQARQLGQGRVEGGCCGALHAACELAEDETERRRLRTEFVAKAGSEKCRDIRKSGTLSCGQCVELAATLLAGRPSAWARRTLKEESR
jgi:hypothetical protein